MSAVRNWKRRNIKVRGGEWRPLSAFEERHDVVVVERKVCKGVSAEEIWRDYIAAKRLLEIAETVDDEAKARIQRERVEMLEEELRDAAMCEDYEDMRWC